MLNEKVINDAYKILINGMLNGIKEEYKEEVSANYMKYLIERYSNIEVTEENIKDYLRKIIISEKRMWEDHDVNYRLQLLKNDNSFDIIRDISQRGFNLATASLDDSSKVISKEEAEENINIMMRELNNVCDFNNNAARKLVSEGILDYKFASGNDELMSMRLYHVESNTK